ncbi:MAG: hypothetical protein ACLUFV_12830 [Acutalibacteraceae bacterium]
MEDLNLGSTQFAAGEDSTVLPLCGIGTRRSSLRFDFPAPVGRQRERRADAGPS